MRIKFTADYDHKWPSRAVTAFKAGWEGTVKREVGELAISKGKATEVATRATPASDASENNGRADRLGGGDTRSPASARAGGNRGQPDGNGDGASAAVPGTVNPSDAQ